MKLIEFFDRGVSLGKDHPCLIDAAGSRSYGDVQATTHRVANACIRDGLKVGTPFAVFSGNQALAFEVLLGCVRAGCVWVPANARSGVGELAHVFALTGTKVLFYAASLAPQVTELQAQSPSLTTFVCIDGKPSAGNHFALEDWLAGAAETSPELDFSDDELVTLFPTGGTTGYPKAVMGTHRVWDARIASTLLRIGCERPVQLVAAPMTHAAGAGALELMALGSTTVILPVFDPAAVIEAIGRHRVTHLFLPPTALYRVLSHPDARKGDYSSLHTLTVAAAPISPDKLIEAVTLFGPVVEQAFGGTELGTSTCSFHPHELAAAAKAGDREKLKSCGRPTPLSRVEIVDADGRILPPGEVGEIIVKSTSNANGYFGNPEETAKAFRHGWFHTGDLGSKDEQGFVYIRDRLKDMLISGGYNVYPSEVERALLAHAAVQDCAVIGVPDAEWGEAVTAVVECKAGQQASAEELMAFAKARLSSYKVPKSVVFRELPRSPVGKVLKRVLRDEYWSASGRAI
jgi:acyl-CoA synthetase (AMP-forming)/AMP-acid ligase II